MVKGVQFVDIKDAGDPVEAAVGYCKAGADELVFLDIAATLEGRGTTLDLVKRVAEHVSIPFTVGGGIRSLADIGAVLAAGADKVSLNSIAVKKPDLITQAANQYGSERIVVAIDAVTNEEGKKEVVIAGGSQRTGKDPVAWSMEAERLGAGAILFTSMDRDGTHSGYDLDLTRRISEAVDIPVIASGGAGKMEDFLKAFTIGGADAALAAGLFHFGEVKIPDLKRYLAAAGIPVFYGEASKSPSDSVEFGLPASSLEGQTGRKDFAGYFTPEQADRLWLQFKLNSEGLIPVIAVDAEDKSVLMLAYMNAEAFALTLQTGRMHYYSRSRQALWLKGETSGHFQTVEGALVDCDSDTLLFSVWQKGAACHTGHRTCFFRTFEEQLSSQERKNNE